ncbi:MAG: BlaI/MecI/CopY family transcriptional regulator, partial [Caulobacteraceae bacterium]|nr:BlaI/MecI/CopY family transcriptional regulator [Caulobacteraceae bacterium]
MKISGAESVVMEALWRKAPQTSEDLCAAVAPGQGWSEATVRTLLHRLVGKGAVSTQAEGRRFFYSPVLARADYVAAESRGLIDRLFEGSLASLVS